MHTTEQRRKFTRIAFHGTARLLLDAYEIECVVHDLSLRGALLIVQAPAVQDVLKVGERCLLELAPDEGAAIRIEADIVHRQGERVGLVCREIALESMINLRRLLELNLGDAVLMNREISALF